MLAQLLCQVPRDLGTKSGKACGWTAKHAPACWPAKPYARDNLSSAGCKAHTILIRPEKHASRHVGRRSLFAGPVPEGYFLALNHPVRGQNRQKTPRSSVNYSCFSVVEAQKNRIWGPSRGSPVPHRGVGGTPGPPRTPPRGVPGGGTPPLQGGVPPPGGSGPGFGGRVSIANALKLPPKKCPFFAPTLGDPGGSQGPKSAKFGQNLAPNPGYPPGNANLSGVSQY